MNSYTLKLEKDSKITFNYISANSCEEAISKSKQLRMFDGFEILGVLRGVLDSF